MSMPAITDSDLARLLGAGSTVPAMPTSLADRVMAAIPAQAVPQPLPALPPVMPARRLGRSGLGGGAGRRWVRAGLATVAGLGLATAVAAGLARTPMFAPVLAPVMETIAAATGLPLLAPPGTPAKVAAPQRGAPAVPPRLAQPQSAPSRLDTLLPSAAMPELPAQAPPRVQMAPPARPDLPAAAPARAVPDAVRADRPAIRRETAPSLERPLADRLGIERPVADRGDLPRPENATRPAIADRIMERLPDGQPVRPEPANPAAVAPPAPATGDSPAAAPGATPEAPARPETGADARADINAEITALREARQSGQLTAQQAQRLRALQQLRALRAARPPRDAARPRR